MLVISHGVLAELLPVLFVVLMRYLCLKIAVVFGETKAATARLVFGSTEPSDLGCRSSSCSCDFLHHPDSCVCPLLKGFGVSLEFELHINADSKEVSRPTEQCPSYSLSRESFEGSLRRFLFQKLFQDL
ncbi:hypothetical protein E2C01_059985 [Portunus trituberculatus]|uniref:Uncharacterized protein n=1 Tax=Portunus trituberculatus TaxID=210409 RepID=A0A5B7H7N3_PORTR|nr:hypothetical protein [Portunus trituberculatus]